MGIVNAVDICKYPQHFNRLLLIAMNKYVLFLIFIFSCIGCGETNEQDANTIEGNRYFANNNCTSDEFEG